MGFVEWFTKPLKDAPDAKAKSANIREEALAQMRAARERIGDDEIQKMAETLRAEGLKMRAEKARKEILSADKGKVADHVRSMLRDE